MELVSIRSTLYAFLAAPVPGRPLLYTESHILEMRILRLRLLHAFPDATSFRTWYQGSEPEDPAFGRYVETSLSNARLL